MLAFEVGSQPEALKNCSHDFAAWPTEDHIAKTCPHSNFLKGLKWSPDGCCLLTASEDRCLRIFDLPQDALTGGGGGPDSWPVSLRLAAGELIYDFAWYPAFDALEPQTCCFLSTCRGHPIHLWDACNGALRCTYRAYNAVDEITAAYCASFSGDGTKVVAGYNKAIRVFDTGRPGRQYRTITTQKKGLGGNGLAGIVSCIAFAPSGSGVFAAGTYSKAVGIFREGSNDLELVLHGHTGGVTQVQWSPDGNYLYSGARMDEELICWDVRYSPGPVYRMSRPSGSTNQRIQFDIEPCGRLLGTGGQAGKVHFFDLQTGEQAGGFQAALDTVNGFQFHPSLPLAATSSGHRRFPLSPASDSDGEGEETCFRTHDMEGTSPPRRADTPLKLGLQGSSCNSLWMWRFPYQHLPEPLAEDFPAQCEEAQGCGDRSTADVGTAHL